MELGDRRGVCGKVNTVAYHLCVIVTRAVSLTSRSLSLSLSFSLETFVDKRCSILFYPDQYSDQQTLLKSLHTFSEEEKLCLLGFSEDGCIL